MTAYTRLVCLLSCGYSGGGSERGISPSAAKYSPQGRMHRSIRSPIAVRRTPSRELVSFGRHKLRRLPHTTSRTSKEHTQQTIVQYCCYVVLFSTVSYERLLYSIFLSYIFSWTIAPMSCQPNAHPWNITYHS